MIRRASLAVLLLGVSAATACAKPPRRVHNVRFVSSPVEVLDVTATELVLDVSASCVSRTIVISHTRRDVIEEPITCAGQVTVITPWGRRLPAQLHGGAAVVPLDWREAGDDPFDPELPARLGGPWLFEHHDRQSSWQPDEEEVARMVVALGEATDTQVDLSTGGPPPDLAVAELAVDGGELRVDGPSRLRLRIVNRGPGDAHRVVVQVRSSHPRLHGLRFPFGLVRAGAEKVRVREVRIPVDEYEPEVTSVLVFTEADGFVPPSHVQRLSMVKLARPYLALACVIDGAGGERAPARLRAGQDIRVDCSLRNHGVELARDVVVEATLEASRAVRTVPAVAAQGQASVHLPLAVPLAAIAGEQFAVRVEAHEARYATRAVTEVPIVVAVATVCQQRLSRDEFQIRRRKLIDLRDQGALTAAEFARFEAELVECLE
jgi:hypothetical protein